MFTRRVPEDIRSCFRMVNFIEQHYRLLSRQDLYGSAVFITSPYIAVPHSSLTRDTISLIAYHNDREAWGERELVAY
jgi:hypothetical protein